ncbi:hypothetical protein OROGR_028935 [Orobanche gracilis]
MDSAGAIAGSLDGSYKPLIPLYFTFMVIWAFSAISWTFNTCKNGHFQGYSYFSSNSCSLWISFGVYIVGIVFQTSAVVSLFLISHGYCITCRRLSLSERRAMAVQACVFYMTLVGYRASVPYFSGLLLLNYLIVFYVMFNHISRNLSVLREQLSFVDDEDDHAMHDAVYTKYIMFKKFQGAMQVAAVSELAVRTSLSTLVPFLKIFVSTGNPLESYWIRLLIREWAQFLIFMYIGWIFRCQESAPRFSLMPTWSSIRETTIPPVYSIEMDSETFKRFRSHEWNIGVPTLPRKGSLKDSVVVVIRQPNAYGISIHS